ncbi:MAG: hypothetical protein NUV74_01415 [Candidatus Brocadiaceae bacterium]|nr:hypothetical protein [Candidatus Brocadiaceae bacterium]
MNLSAYEIALISVGGTISGALMGAWISYKLAVQLTEISARREAARKILSTFHRELSEIYPYPIKWPENITVFLESKFAVLNAAVGEFRHYLPDKKRDNFDRAWFGFYNATGREIDNKNCQCYLHYIPFSGVSVVNGKEIHNDNTKTYKEDFKKNIDALLTFTKQI